MGVCTVKNYNWCGKKKCHDYELHLDGHCDAMAPEQYHTPDNSKLDDPDQILKYHLKSQFAKEITQEEVYFKEQGLMEKIRIALLATVDEILQNDFFHAKQKHRMLQNVKEMYQKTKIEGFFNHREQSIIFMNRLNELNWQYYVKQNKIKRGQAKLMPDDYMPDFESICIINELALIKRDPHAHKLIQFTAHKMEANLYSCVLVDTKTGGTRIFKKALKNVRETRERPDDTYRSEALQLLLDSEEGQTPDEKDIDVGAYGIAWSVKIKGKDNELPTFTEMMDGIFNWYIYQMINQMDNANSSQQHKEHLVNMINIHFMKFKNSINFPKVDEPMNNYEDDAELGLWNPYSKITCLILYLNSMEIGSPPLYAEMNRVARDMDMIQLKNLGPIMRAMNEITSMAEKASLYEDQIRTGKQIGDHMNGVKWNMAGSFLLYRGAQMQQNQLMPWLLNVGKDVKIPGVVSCTQNLKYALGLAMPRVPKGACKATLFVICCQNYHSLAGVRIKNHSQTAYPAEREILLMDQSEMFVLEVYKSVQIDNIFQGFERFHGKKITIIYLYHRI